MKFKSKVGKSVMCKGKIITFKTDEHETSCEKEIEALKNAKGVTQVKKSKKA